MKHIAYIILLLLICTSCKTDKQTQIAQYIQAWQQKELLFPNELHPKSLGKDTTWDHSKGRYKLLVYIDSTGCTSCRLGLPKWKQLIDTCTMENRDVNFLFVVQSNNYKEFEHQLRLYDFTHPIIYDPTDEFNRLNNFPREPEYQTFLLDANNRVVMLGSPVQNKAIRELYMKLIRQ